MTTEESGLLNEFNEEIKFAEIECEDEKDKAKHIQIKNRNLQYLKAATYERKSHKTK